MGIRLAACLVAVALAAEAGALVGMVRARRRADAIVLLDRAPGPTVPVELVAARLAARRDPPVTDARLDRVLACIRRWESDSSGGYRAVNPTGKYRGAYQVDRQFWLDYGGDPALAGDPRDRSTWRWETAPPAAQDQVAIRGYLARDLRPWPLPARRCAGVSNATT